MFDVQLVTQNIEIDELEVMVSQMGVEGFIGFSLQQELDKKEVLRLLNEMSLKRMIEVKEKGFEIKQPYLELVEEVARAKVTLVISPRSLEHIKKCFYIGDYTVIASHSRISKKRIDFTKIENDQIAKEIRECGYLFDEDEEPDIGSCDISPSSKDEILKISVYESGSFLENIVLTKIDGKKIIGILTVNDTQYYPYSFEQFEKTILEVCS